MNDKSSKAGFNKASAKTAKNYKLPKPQKSMEQIRQSVKSKKGQSALRNIEQDTHRRIDREHVNHRVRQENFKAGVQGGLHLPEQEKAMDTQHKNNLDAIEQDALKQAQKVAQKNLNLKPYFLKAKLGMSKQFEKGREK